MSLTPQSPVVDWANQTNLHWAGLALTLVLAFGTLVLPRRWVPLMLLILACFIPPGQRLALWTLDLTLLRLLVLFTWLRIAVRREWHAYRLQTLDLILIAWALVALIAYTLQHGTKEALIFKLGTSFDAVALYFLFRVLVRGWHELERVALTIALLALPVCFAFMIEWTTGRNLFSVFGGVAEFTEIRLGRLRCQGAFAHSILAGCYWAAALPLVASLWWSKSGFRGLAAIGSICALAIIVLCASSTPVLAAGFGVLAGAAFLARRWFQVGRIALVLGLVSLHFLMKAPVWHLLSRADVVGGSTGWHRFYLVDQAIRHFDEWWLLGTPSTDHWGRGLADITCQYVLEATRGGLLQLLLFLCLIAFGFRTVGRAVRFAWPDRTHTALAWALGASLLTHCVSFIGVSYFGQEWILWYLILACLGSLSALSLSHEHQQHLAVPRSYFRRPRQGGLTYSTVPQKVPLTVGPDRAP